MMLTIQSPQIYRNLLLLAMILLAFMLLGML